MISSSSDGLANKKQQIDMRNSKLQLLLCITVLSNADVFLLFEVKTFCTDYHTLGHDKVSMLIHTYQHKTLMRITWPSAITGLATHFICGMILDAVTSRIEKRMIIQTPIVLTVIRCHYTAQTN